MSQSYKGRCYTVLTTTDKVNPANLFLYALFSTTEVTLQNKATITCNYNPNRAYIPTILKYGTGAVSSQLNNQLFFTDDADSPGVTDPALTNNRLFKRAKLIIKTIDLRGAIFHDLFSMSRYLINPVDVKIKVYRSSA